MQSNYYVILGIGPDANPAQIRKAFRQRAHECHPDHDPEGAEHFSELTRAYNVLSDPAEKARYDQRMRLRRHAPRHVAAPAPVDLMRDFGTYSPSIQEVTDLFAQNFIAARQPKATHIRDLHLEMVITPEEATSGGHLVLGVPVFKPCQSCQGSGRTGYYLCEDCGGVGNEEITAQVDVLIPRGTADGTIIPVSLRHLGIRNMNLLLHLRIA